MDAPGSGGGGCTTGMTLFTNRQPLDIEDLERCQWDDPLLSARYFASTEIGVIGLKRAGLHTPDDPLRVEHDFALLTDILTV